MSGKAYFYVVPWSLVTVFNEARAARVAAGEAGGPMCCCETRVHPPAADTPALAHVHWGDGNGWVARERFEAQPEVIALGEPWEPVPAEAVAFLEEFRQAHVSTRAERIGVSAKQRIAVKDPSTPIDATHTVGQALQKAFPLMAHEMF
jgi:hypothetical protein